VSLKNKLVLCGVVSATALLVSVVTYSPLGLMAVPMMLLIATDLGVPFRRRPEAKLRAARSVQQKVLVTDPVLVELTVENDGADIERLTAEDRVPSETRLARGSTGMLCAIPHGKSATLRYQVSLQQPAEIRFGGTEVRIQSILALFETRISIPAPAILRAYPRLMSRKVAAGRAKALTWTGSSPSRYRGGRVEFIDIRDYVAGDPLKDVNWKASARLGRKLVNAWSVERGLDCIIVVDMSLDILPTVGDWNARGDVITCSYELASTLIASGNRVGMLIMGTTPAKIRPGFGTRHLRLMLDQLVLAQPGLAWKMERVDEFLESFFRTQYRNRGGALIFVAPGVDTSLLRVQRDLVAKGFTCNSVVVNTLENEAAAIYGRKLESSEKIRQGSRFARSELDWFETQLSKCSQVNEWRSDRGFLGLEEAMVNAT